MSAESCQWLLRPREPHRITWLRRDCLVFLLLCLGLSAAGGQKEELRGVVGGNITLPDSVLQRGFLLFKESVIASVRKGEFENENPAYKDRVHWNKQTGLFTITDLQISDSGDLKLEYKKEPRFSFSYQLRVSEPVPTPEVSTVNINLTTSGDPNQTTTGPNQEKRHQPVPTPEVSTVTINLTTSGAPNQTTTGPNQEKRHQYWIIAAVTAGFLIAVVLLSVWFKKKTTVRQTQDSVRSNDDVQYTQIHISNRSQVGNGTGSSGPENGSV